MIEEKGLRSWEIEMVLKEHLAEIEESVSIQKQVLLQTQILRIYLFTNQSN